MTLIKHMYLNEAICMSLINFDMFCRFAVITNAHKTNALIILFENVDL